MTFGVAVVLGTLAGSFAYAWSSGASAGKVLLRPPIPRNHVIGGILMGFGGVTAMGCTIGQGITGISTLALGSILVFFSIIAGAALTMKIQYSAHAQSKLAQSVDGIASRTMRFDAPTDRPVECASFLGG